MPDGSLPAPRVSARRTSGETAAGEQTTVPAHPRVSPRTVLTTWAVAIVVLVVVAVLIRHWRGAAARAWKSFAEKFGGELQMKNGLSPARILGKLGERDAILETATSHEDDAPYFHTRFRLPIKNDASFVMGLRRKSLLEEVQTRKEPVDYGLEDAEFDRLFFVICNDRDHLPAILTPEVRRELHRHPDVEVYIHLGEMEWRRAGEQSDLSAITRLSEMLGGIADAVDALPARARTLSERLADEELIAKGV